MVWIIALSISIPVFLFFLSIPSMVCLYRKGRIEYFRDIKILYSLYHKMSLCYKIDVTRTYSYQYPNGTNKKFNQLESDYYLPIYLSDKKVYIIHKKVKDLFYDIEINDAIYENGVWKTDIFKVKKSVCIYTQILNDRFQRKVNKLMENPFLIEKIDNLNELINSEIVSIRRESKLNQLLING